MVWPGKRKPSGRFFPTNGDSLMVACSFRYKFCFYKRVRKKARLLMTDPEKAPPSEAKPEGEEEMLARQERLAALQAAIAAGTYHPDLEALADRLLQELAAEELHRRRQALKGDADLPESPEVSPPDAPQTGTEEQT